MARVDSAQSSAHQLFTLDSLKAKSLSLRLHSLTPSLTPHARAPPAPATRHPRPAARPRTAPRAPLATPRARSCPPLALALAAPPPLLLPRGAGGRCRWHWHCACRRRRSRPAAAAAPAECPPAACPVDPGAAWSERASERVTGRWLAVVRCELLPHAPFERVNE